jgi:hypothetical protein
LEGKILLGWGKHRDQVDILVIAQTEVLQLWVLSLNRQDIIALAWLRPSISIFSLRVPRSLAQRTLKFHYKINRSQEGHGLHRNRDIAAIPTYLMEFIEWIDLAVWDRPVDCPTLAKFNHIPSRLEGIPARRTCLTTPVENSKKHDTRWATEAFVKLIRLSEGYDIYIVTLNW